MRIILYLLNSVPMVCIGEKTTSGLCLLRNTADRGSKILVGLCIVMHFAPEGRRPVCCGLDVINVRSICA